MAPKTKMASKPKKSPSPVASNNFQADFSLSNFNDDVKIMAAILRQSELNVYFQCTSSQTPIRYITHAYQSAEYTKETDTLTFKLVDDSSESLTSHRFVSLLGGHEEIPELPPVYEPMPSDDDLSSFLDEIGYEDTPPSLGDLKKAKFPAPWHMAVHFVLRCLSGKTGGTDAIVKDLLRLLWGIYYKKTLILEAFFGMTSDNTLWRRRRRFLRQGFDPKLSTNPKCPPSIRRLPLHLLRLIGMKRKVVKEYRIASVNLLPAIADVGADPEEPVAEATEHASEEEEETDSQTLRRKPKSFRFKSPPKSLYALGKNAQPSIIFSRTFHHMHTRTSTYGYDPRGEPTRPERLPLQRPAQQREIGAWPFFFSSSMGPFSAGFFYRSCEQPSQPGFSLFLVTTRPGEAKDSHNSSALGDTVTRTEGCTSGDTAAITSPQLRRSDRGAWPESSGRDPLSTYLMIKDLWCHTPKSSQGRGFDSLTEHFLRGDCWGRNALSSRDGRGPQSNAESAQGCCRLRIWRLSHLGSPKELATIAGSGGQGSNLFRLGSYVTELYGASGPMQLLRELESHCGEQHWDTHEIIGPGEYSIRGYGSNLPLISGTSGVETETEAPEKPSPEKKRKEVPEKSTPEKKKNKASKKPCPETKPAEEESSNDSTKKICSLLTKRSGSKPTQAEIDLLKQTLLQLKAIKDQQAAASKAAAEAEATKSTIDKPPPQKTTPALQPPQQPPKTQPPPPPPQPIQQQETVPLHQSSLQEGGDEYSGHLSAPLFETLDTISNTLIVPRGPDSPSRSINAPPSKKIIFKRKHAEPVSPPKQQDQPPSPPPPPKKKKKTVRRQALPTVTFPGVTHREFSGMKNKMDRVLEMVAAYPTPATDEELNSRLSTVVEEVVDKQLSATLSKHAERLVEIEEALARTIHHLGEVVDVIAKEHEKEIAERDQRMRDLERLNLKLISAGETMVLMTKKALDGPNSTIVQIIGDVSALLKTYSQTFDSLSKALSLSTSSILDGIANLKLVEAVLHSKGGEEEDEANKNKPSSDKIDPEKIINLEKTPPTEGPEQEKEKTPPADPKGKTTDAGQGPPKKDTLKKFVDLDKPGPSSPKADESSGFSDEEEEDEAEKARKAKLAETERLGRETALLLDAELKAEEATRMEECRLREQEEATRLAAERTLVTRIQRVPPTGKDIVPFMTYALPGPDEVLDCPVSKIAALVPMMDPIKGETNLDVRAASEFKRSYEARDEIHYLVLRDIINAIIFDFGYEDAELHPHFPTAPPLQAPNTSFEGIGDISRCYSLEPIRALAYEEEQSEEGMSPQMLCFRLEEKHLYPSDFLQNFVTSLEEDEDMDAADKESLLSELLWFLTVRKHWRALLRFIDSV
ncbi:hypothetical protein LXL04_007637 [Taraxacum kok-saghyz]